MSLTDEERAHLVELFNGTAIEPTSSNPLYAAIGKAVAQSPATIEIFSEIDESKRRPVSLFAAVHFLILRGEEHPLAQLYDSPELKGVIERAGAEFVSFCEDYSDEIVRVLHHRTVQTNEVNRSVGLLPALMEVGRETHSPLALLELGASAGLNLLFDRFRYDYVGGSVVGPPGAGVRLSTHLRGLKPRLDSSMPLVDYRLGIDIDPVNISDDDEVLWMRACLWVGEVAREQRLDAALALAKREWPSVREGDALTDLPGMIENVDPNLELCIYNSFMMSWLDEEQQNRLIEILSSIATYRSLWWITFEAPGSVPGIYVPADIPPDGSVLTLQHFYDGGRDIRVLAIMNHQGSWLDWLDQSSAAQ